MDRLFLRIQLHIFASLMIAGVVCGILIAPRINERIDRNAEEISSVPVAVLAQVLSDNRHSESEMQGSLTHASVRLGTGAELIRRSDAKLDARELAQLDRGEVVRSGRAAGMDIFARIDGSDKLLRLGPLRVGPPMRSKTGLAILLVVMTALSIGVFWFLRPIRYRLAALGQTARALGQGDLRARATVGPHDAIGTLALAFNRMAAEIERLIALQEELLRMTSHELRTPIQRVHFALESIRDADDETTRERGLRLIERDLEELDRLIEELLTYVRLGERRAPIRQSLEVRQFLVESFEVLSELKGDMELNLDMQIDAPLRTEFDPRLVRRAISNLIVNALRHAKSRVDVHVMHEGQTIQIDVDDDGAGIPIADRERIFEPFQRLEDERTQRSRGFGLGLAIVRRVAEVHGGSIVALRSDLGGARMRLSLSLHT